MRADRLLSILLLLQTRQRMTARDLAQDRGFSSLDALTRTLVYNQAF
jgi:predicted DNA-binding transcriptional regulator YafY